ncbi:hypothetical protein G4G93_29730 [Methylobacterium sp. DB0501]|uniref:hypothetical protein n=1 Tax=Methylobacterium sp. DB0501 TaxID=2709665 RepID=UPI0013EDB8DF|nr:hypothetical protein [Methylobacterium sp. DB0501]NGM38037.1 hypothetical protein [Methylobacterium sp. DB0501]
MIRRVALLSATLFLSAVGSAQAEKLSLPVGEWGHSSNHGLDCSPPFLKIEPNRVVKRIGGGEGRCPVKKIKKDGRYIRVFATCEYDKSIPDEYLIQGDEDEDSFTLIVKGPTKILFNNTPHELCASAGGVK